MIIYIIINTKQTQNSKLNLYLIYKEADQKESNQENTVKKKNYIYIYIYNPHEANPNWSLYKLTKKKAIKKIQWKKKTIIITYKLKKNTHKTYWDRNCLFLYEIYLPKKSHRAWNFASSSQMTLNPW